MLRWIRRGLAVLIILMIGVLCFLILRSNEYLLMKHSKALPSSVDNLAEVLRERVRVLCWVMTSPKTYKTRAKAIKDTWAKRCSITLFFSSFRDKKFPVIELDAKEGRDYLSIKTIEAFRYIYRRYLNEADWFLKADDDTYVIVENLRYLLAHYDPNLPNYFGHHFLHPIKIDYASGGAGYVLSKEALRRLNEDGYATGNCPNKSHGPEDLEVAKCLRRVGVNIGKSADIMDRPSFHPFKPYHHITDEMQSVDWYTKYTKYGRKWGAECCSEYTISFHYVLPEIMYTLDLAFYGIKLFGVTRIFNDTLVDTIFRHVKNETVVRKITELKINR